MCGKMCRCVFERVKSERRNEEERENEKVVTRHKKARARSISGAERRSHRSILVKN